MSLLAYSDKIETNVEWLGDLPRHWRVTRLKQVCNVFPSNVDKKSNEGDPPIQLCNYTDVYYNDRITSDLPFMSATATYDQIERFSLRAGDTIVTKDSETADDIAIPAYVPRDLPGVICGYHLSMLRPFPGTHGAFIKWLFDSKFVRASVQVRANGLTRVGLGQYDLDNLEIPFPPYAEQIAIAAFLDRETGKVDALVEEQKRLIALLKEKRQAVISHAVTKGLNPDATMKDSGVEWLGEVPEHWSVCRIGALFREVSDEGVSDLPILSVSINDGVSDKELEADELDRNVARSEDRTKYKRVAPGDLAYNMMRAWQGGFGAVKVDGMVSPAYVVARPRQKLETSFVEYILRTKRAVEEMRRHSRGVTEFRLRLYWDEFKAIQIALPPADEQSAILRSIDGITRNSETLISESTCSIGLLQERRAALISAAVTGKIDVREASASYTQLDHSRARTVVAAEIIERLAHEPTFGRVKLQKLVYLTEAHVGVSELEGDYLREAAGPLDWDMIAEMETRLQREGHVSIDQAGGRGGQVTYRICGPAKAYRQELVALLGNRAPKFNQLIADLGNLKTESVEAVATLYAVWNDALLEGHTPTDDAIIAGALNDWHPEKANKFKPSDLHEWLDWMRRHKLVPEGKGPRTRTGRLFP